MKQSTLVLIIFFVISCTDRNKLPAPNSNIRNKFEIKIYDSDYSLAYSKIYKLNEYELSIVFHGEIKGEKDSTFFNVKLSNDLAEKLSNIDIRHLKSSYVNECAYDGSQIFIEFKKDSLVKSVQLSNYYEKSIGSVIEIINLLVPKEHAIWYNKKELFESMKRCGIDTSAS